MYSFRNDYSEGAAPAVLDALVKTNAEQTCGYGLDPYCEKAAAVIQKEFGAADAAVHFVVGGTQANLLVIHAMLESYEAVIAASTGHVNVHETGAIEATGHKVCSIPAPDGKLTPALIETVVRAHSSEHMVHPRLVYLSDTTEVGTLYTKAELSAIHDCCRENGLLLFLDGARLGSALTAADNDLLPTDLPRLTDIFTIGGTKNGALFGEAIVLATTEGREHFRWYMKQRGAMLAKGRLLGVQYLALFTDGLYWDLARHENAMAVKLRDGLTALGVPFSVPAQSNQLFPAFSNAALEKLSKQYEFEIDQSISESETRIRLVTSWATPEEAITAFLRDCAAIL
ncbi:MAG: beta-eliminating lyase-related protein [Oscillibacter sp.]|jgi:threonine aldolase|nr:beta-eliminating lyase-related protein [Oscillibacter sp.]